MAIRRQLVVLVGLAFLVVPAAAQNGPAPEATAKAGESHLPPIAPAPQPVLTLEQMPPGPTIVTYDKGELTIQAQNATLRDVLRAVCSRIGVLLDIPPGSDERVVALAGPGPVREVIASLLNGSQFNYVFLGSANDPNSVSRIVLSPRPAHRQITSDSLQGGNPGYQPSSGDNHSAQVNAPPVATNEPTPARDQAQLDTNVKPLEQIPSVVAEPANPSDSSSVASSPAASSTDADNQGTFLHRLRRRRHVRPSVTQ